MSHTVNRPRLFVAACAGMALFGISLAMPGTILGFPAMRERLQIGVEQQGVLSSLLLVGVWISTLFVGPVIDRFGNKVVLASSACMASVGFGAMLSATSFWLMSAAVTVLGLGAGGFNTATNAVVSAIYEEKRATMLNVLGVFFGGGAFLLPGIAARWSPETAIACALAFALLCAVGYLSLTFPPAREAHTFTLCEALKVVKYPGVLLFAAVMFCESANEQTMNSFTSTWLGAAGMAAARAAIVYSAYHLSMALGRILILPVLRRASKRAVVIGSSIGAVCGTGIFWRGAATNPSPLLMGIGVVVTALSFSPIYPTLLGIAGDRYDRFAGTVFGFLFSIAMLGAIISPSAVGIIGKQHGTVLAGAIVPLVGTVLVLTFGVLATRPSRATKGASDQTIEIAE